MSHPYSKIGHVGSVGGGLMLPLLKDGGYLWCVGCVGEYYNEGK